MSTSILRRPKYVIYDGFRASSLVRKPTELAGVAEESSFARMSRDQRRWSSARPPGMPEFVRKGIIGDWRKLKDEFARRTAGTGPYELWPDILAEVDRYTDHAT